MSVKIITLLLSSSILIIVIELIRREKLTFKYAFGWIVVCVLAIIAAVFHSIIFKLAHLFGFILPSNFIFFTLLTVLVFLSLLMTLFLCEQNSRNDSMAQRIGTMQFEIDELKKETEKTKEK